MLPPLHCFSYCYQLYLFCAQKLSHTLRCVLFSHRPLCYLVSSCVISSSVCRLFFPSFLLSFLCRCSFVLSIVSYVTAQPTVCGCYQISFVVSDSCTNPTFAFATHTHTHTHTQAHKRKEDEKKIIPTTARHKKKLYACNTMLVYGTEQ